MKKLLLVFALQMCFYSFHCASIRNTGTPNAGSRMKVIVDVDAGADDAGALLLLLEAGVDIVAITCVNGNTGINNVLVNVVKTLHSVGRLDIPVYKGTTKAIHGEKETDSFFGSDGFGDFDYGPLPEVASVIQKENAVEAMVKMVNRYPGEITLLGLAPLTNIALAVRLDPSFLSKVKQLVIMGGNVEGRGHITTPEFNFSMDPVATSIVFREITQPVLIVPRETIRQMDMPKSWRTEILGKLNTPAVQLLNKAEGKQFTNTSPQWICSDCITAAVLLDPSIILRHTLYNASLDMDGCITNGILHVDPNAEVKNTDIVEQISDSGYQKLLLRYLGRSEH